ncbi:hypothetical protein EBN03_24265 [Nocardia stercoris]|uniref:Uncharacterized protein n=1 Tax=Nocardia stercoris TaxID=2483361 RepID=A0A3M2L5T2_9NOCA|nr:hypothetical protein EBN03_24265 [Nocardia stercoris]
MCGVGAAWLTLVRMRDSWDGCEIELDAGGRFAMTFLFLVALIVMPLMSTAIGASSILANAKLLRTDPLARRSTLAPIAITVVGGVGLWLVVEFLVSKGAPPVGYCGHLRGA